VCSARGGLGTCGVDHQEGNPDRVKVTLEPWAIVADDLGPDDLARAETLFAVSNGHVGWRGMVDEGEPRATPGVYLNGFFERHRMPYAEDGYGYPKAGETVVNALDGTLIRLTLADESLDIRTGTIHEHRLRLDLRAGIVQRDLEWTSPDGRRIRLRSRRLISFERRPVGAIELQIDLLDDTPVDVMLRSELVADDDQPDGHDEPAIAEAIVNPLEPVHHDVADGLVRLSARTRSSALTTAAAMGHLIEGDVDDVSLTSSPRLGCATITALVKPGRPLKVVKVVAAAHASERSSAGLLDDVSAAAHAALDAGWQRLGDEQRAVLDEHWQCAEVDIEGAPDLQAASRFALFQLLQASARADDEPIGAKGLTGRGYDGHTFWDTETFILPALTYLRPQAAAAALRWRHRTLGRARGRAAQLGFAGAAFPWRTIDGEECSGYWPAGSAAVHIGGDIAAAVTRHISATGDTGFVRDAGLELLVEIARFWMSFGHLGRDGLFHLDGVTGPDEYSAVADDNVYTNVLAQSNLRQAAAEAEQHPDVARGLGVDHDEILAWRHAADRMSVPFDERLGVHPQSRGFTEHAEWDFGATGPGDYPMHSHFPYLDLYRKQVAKQADLVLALHLRHDAFTPEQKLRDFVYYEPLTVRDSSLSAASQAIIAAEVGFAELALDYVREAALIDLADLHGNTSEGLHVASLAGFWIALVAGFGGMRHSPHELLFAPRLPPGITGLRFGMRLGSGVLRVEITASTATYRLSGGDTVRFRHHGGDETALDPGQSVTLDLPAGGADPAAPATAPPRQPPHRSPREILQRSPVRLAVTDV
jgi:alpha,alpha-trehalose phosphorylase